MRKCPVYRMYSISKVTLWNDRQQRPVEPHVLLFWQRLINCIHSTDTKSFISILFTMTDNLSLWHLSAVLYPIPCRSRYCMNTRVQWFRPFWKFDMLEMIFVPPWNPKASLLKSIFWNAQRFLPDLTFYSPKKYHHRWTPFKNLWKKFLQNCQNCSRRVSKEAQFCMGLKRCINSWWQKMFI